MFRNLMIASTCLAGLAVTACGPSSAPSETRAEPQLVFPDMPAPGNFNRAYTLTENAAGNIRVFTRETRDDTDLFITEKQAGGSWSEPVKLDWPKRYSNANPHFSPLDGRLYFASDRPLPGEERGNDMNIWSIERLEDGWGEAAPVAGDVNTGAGETSVTTTANGEMFFVSKHPRGQGGQDIYLATLDDETGEWKLGYLPEKISSPRVESHIAATPDGQHIIFYSYRSPKLGVVDLVAASRNEAGEWIGPYNLGPVINTRGIDYGAGFSETGETFFFSREGEIMTLPTAELLPILTEAQAAYEAGNEEGFLGMGGE